MTHLRIELNNIPETVSAAIIRKLYETALSVPEPNEGEEDSAYLSGTLLTPYAYKSHVDYLTERFSDLYINVTSDYYIEFTDPKVEQYLIAAGIGDGVGITTTAAATANIGTALKEKTDITSFNEFKYFTKENTTPTAEQMFKGCSNLQNIDLTNCKKIVWQQFRDCTSLNNIDVKNVEYIGDGIFRNVNMDILYFKSLVNGTANATWWCGPISKSLPSYRWVNKAIFELSTIKQAYFPSLIRACDNSTFRNYYTCQPMFGGGAGAMATVLLIYFKDLQKVYGGTFANLTCTAIVINNSTPPDICNICDISNSDLDAWVLLDVGAEDARWDKAFGHSTITAVYVPDVSAYQSHPRWSQFNLTFKDISELPRYLTEADWTTAGKPVALIEEYMDVSVLQ